MNNPVTDEYGNKRWYLNGKLHREDGPAVVRYDGVELWYLNNLLHREDGPAITFVDGTQKWFINGLKHRENGPAIIHGKDYPGIRVPRGETLPMFEWWENGEQIIKTGLNTKSARNIL